MKIKKTESNNSIQLNVSGRLDATSAPELEEEIMSALEQDIRELIFDFAELDYISSAGLRLLLVARRGMKNKGTVRVIHVQNEVQEIFDMSGFSDILNI